MTASAIFFYLFSGVAVLFALLVILLRNPITSALSLVVSFFGLSGIYVLLHAPFLGVVQILIYAGAILVLFLYVTMLLNPRDSELTPRKFDLSRLGAVAIAGTLSFFLTMLLASRFSPKVSVEDTFGSLESVGTLLLGENALLFELLSLILLIGIIGTVLLSQKEREKA